jgi:O-antigen ligase
MGKFLIYLFPIALYLPMLATNIISIALVIYLIVNYKRCKLKFLFNHPIVFPSFMLFVMVMFGFFYPIESSGVLNDLEKKLSFIILPISVALIVNKRDVQILLKLFFISGIVAVSVALFMSLIKFTNTGNSAVLSNHGLSNNIGFHATYLSLYLLFSLVFPVFYWNKIKTKKEKIILLIMSFFIGFSLIILSVRIIWVCLFVILILLFLKSSKFKDLLFLHKVVLFLLGLSICFSTIYFISPVKERLKEAINYNNAYNTDKVWGGRGMRLMIWGGSFEVLKQKPYLGYGSTRVVQNKLNKTYKSLEYGPLLYMMNQKGRVFNAHNQYLEEFLKFGFIIGNILPLIFVYWLYIGLKRKNPVLICILLIFMTVCTTETLLELNKGIVFFAFFITLSFKLKPSKLMSQTT